MKQKGCTPVSSRHVSFNLFHCGVKRAHPPVFAPTMALAYAWTLFSTDMPEIIPDNLSIVIFGCTSFSRDQKTEDGIHLFFLSCCMPAGAQVVE